jgi:hypothetical protein
VALEVVWEDVTLLGVVGGRLAVCVDCRRKWEWIAPPQAD